MHRAQITVLGATAHGGGVGPGARAVDRSYRALDDLIAPALRNVQSTLDGFTRLAPVMQSAAGMWSTQITDLMHGWTVLSGFGHRLAGKALHLAIITRDVTLRPARRESMPIASRV